MSDDLIKRLRDALVFELRGGGVLLLGLRGSYMSSADLRKLIAEADAYLASGGWVRVDEALPVVPEGQDRVSIWITRSKPNAVYCRNWVTGGFVVLEDKFGEGDTHWQYAELTPQPPEQTK